jgi:hypothetical protein
MGDSSDWRQRVASRAGATCSADVSTKLGKFAFFSPSKIDVGVGVGDAVVVVVRI